MGDIAKDAKIRHASAYKLRVYPYNGDIAPLDADRVQGSPIGWTRPSDPLYEQGRKLEMARDYAIPDVTVSITQLEYGTMAIWRKLANVADAVTKIVLSDFDDSYADVVTVEDEKYGEALPIYCKHIPKLSVSGITINAPDPDTRLDRVIDLVGDSHKKWKNNNKCFIYKKFTYTSTGDEDLDVSDPAPVKNPDDNKDIWRVLRVKSGVTTELELTTDYTFATNTVTILSPTAGDIYKVYYTATTWGSAGKPTALNDSDDYFVKPEQCDFLLIETESGGSSFKVHKLSSASIAATFDRRMEGELGNDEKVLRDVTSRAITITLGSFVTDGSFDELMRGKAGDNYGLIDITKFVETLKFVIKIYADKTKVGNFKMGYMVENLKYTAGGDDAPANDLASKDITLESDNLTISSVEGDLA